MEITVLIENRSAGNNRLAIEHGLSALVLAHGRRVLFDTGASGAVVDNADALGLGAALADLDAIVVSHGHSDHAGGLAAVLERTRHPVPVHVRPGFFHPRLSTRGGAPKTIGVPLGRDALEARGARVVEENQPREFLPGFWLTGEIPLREEVTAGEPELLLGAAPVEATADPFTDEQAMAVRTARGLAVLVGCAHRGIVNSILAAQAAAGGALADAVYGGAHLRSADQAKIYWSVDRVRRLVRRAVLGHCTGEAAEARFAATFAGDFASLRTGGRWHEEVTS
jgi:7,8-dihydropterin-6-yl-methyl-4-(beta-D-ribofuranosyl)aminobenzene 5'-phosphate synthase